MTEQLKTGIKKDNYLKRINDIVERSKGKSIRETENKEQDRLEYIAREILKIEDENNNLITEKEKLIKEIEDYKKRNQAFKKIIKVYEDKINQMSK